MDEEEAAAGVATKPVAEPEEGENTL